MGIRKRWIALAIVLIALGWMGAEAYRVYRIVNAPAPAAEAPAAPDPATRRQLSQGAVLGFVAPDGAYVWRGIPFAAPPVDELRWRAPRPAAAWQGVRETVEPSPRCPQPQPGPQAQGAQGDEDCLYLDVYAPASARGLPVMVWIHGGANIGGSASQLDASRLAASQQVVVVATNYRLGPLGWFSHPALAQAAAQTAAQPDAGVPDAGVRDAGVLTDAGAATRHDLYGDADRSGNYGTLDLLAALTWVRDTIAHFGGDAGNVTIFGESAGGANVLSLLLAPPAQGLFHRAISQSGVLYESSMTEAQAYADQGGHSASSAEVLLRALVSAGRATNTAAARALVQGMTPAEIADFLHAQTPAALLAATLQPRPDQGDDRPASFPTVLRDGYVVAAGPALEHFARGDYHQVPILLGTNRDEVKLFMARNPELTKPFGERMVRIRDPEQYALLAEYRSEAWRAGTVNALAPRMLAAQNPGVFAYRFDWDEAPDLLILDLGELLGAAHAMEIPFVFGRFDTLGALGRVMFTQDTAESRRQLSDAMMSYWAQFAYAGDPGRGRADALPRWSPWGEDHNVLVLDSEADGGIRMIRDATTIPQLLQRLASDPRAPELADKCRVLYWLARRGRQVPSDAYPKNDALDCSRYPAQDYPW